MTNSADPDQLASLFAKAVYILVQQDKGKDVQMFKINTVILPDQELRYTSQKF